MTNETPKETKPKTWQAFIAHEAFEYFFNLTFLAIVLVTFAWYRRLVLASYHIQLKDYWMPLLEAAILAKVIMLGDALRIGRRLRNRPLAVVTVYRTVAFSLFVAVFSFVEHIVEALFHGKSAAEGIAAITNQGRYEILARCLVIFTAFLPFFAVKELERALGAEKVRRLFFCRSVGMTEGATRD